jgi:hypothetical protein
MHIVRARVPMRRDTLKDVRPGPLLGSVPAASMGDLFSDRACFGARDMGGLQR